MEQLPILIYKGDAICYNMLNEFAQQLGQALEQLGERVEYCMVEEGKEGKLSAYAGRQFKAVIGFQSYLFDIFLPKSGVFLHDYIKGPKFNFQFDHPIWMKSHYEHMPKHSYVVTHDRNYAEFVRRYYPTVEDTFIIPPGGVEAGLDYDKQYDMSFVGTYTDYRTFLPMIAKSSQPARSIAAHFLFEMKQNPNRTAEEALLASLKADGIVPGDGEFLAIFDAVKPVIYCIMSYYREKAVRILLEAGVQLEVFGDSWKNSPLAGYPNLHIHPAINMEESIQIFKKSKISLNIMAWHKDGFTERIANSMLNYSVVLSDKSTYLLEHYRNNEEILLFDLQHLDELPQIIGKADNLNEIAQRSYQRAVRECTWENCARRLLAAIEEVQ